MKVLHVIPSISAVHGGPSTAIRTIVSATTALGADVEVATTDDDGKGARLTRAAGPAIDESDGMCVRFFRKQTEFYKVSVSMGRWVRGHVAQYDVVHIHALFSFVSIAAANSARHAKVPYIISPLGALGRYGMSQRRPGLKRASFCLIERPLLDQAAAVHFTTLGEFEEACEWAPTCRGVVIPLGVDTSVSPGDGLRGDVTLRSSGRCRLAFMGRLDPVKNIEALLEALPIVLRSEPNAVLSIAGSGIARYETRLHRLADSLGLTDSIRWLGHIDACKKQALLNATDVFVLPSHSENFGIAAAEALAAGIPCVLSKGVAIAGDVDAAGAGAAVDPVPEAIAEGILALLRDEAHRRRSSSAARRLAEERYSTRRMGEELVALYERCVLDHKSRDA